MTSLKGFWKARSCCCCCFYLVRSSLWLLWLWIIGYIYGMSKGKGIKMEMSHAWAERDVRRSLNRKGRYQCCPLPSPQPTGHWISIIYGSTIWNIGCQIGQRLWVHFMDVLIQRPHNMKNSLYQCVVFFFTTISFFILSVEFPGIWKIHPSLPLIFGSQPYVMSQGALICLIC